MVRIGISEGWLAEGSSCAIVTLSLFVSSEFGRPSVYFYH